MTSEKKARLFAKLLREEYESRHPWPIGGIASPSGKFTYGRFLRTNIRHGDRYCPYARAVKLIGGR